MLRDIEIESRRRTAAYNRHILLVLQDWGRRRNYFSLSLGCIGIHEWEKSRWCNTGAGAELSVYTLPMIRSMTMRYLREQWESSRARLQCTIWTIIAKFSWSTTSKRVYYNTAIINDFPTKVCWRMLQCRLTNAERTTRLCKGCGRGGKVSVTALTSVDIFFLFLLSGLEHWR